ncbi:MAG: ferritin-like domain-containing protein [Planctomycetota bacterium]
MGNPLTSFILKSLLNSAVNFEEKSADFYKEAVSRVSSPEGKAILRKLAEEEENHMEMLIELVKDDHTEEIIMQENVANLHDLGINIEEDAAIANNSAFAEIINVAEKKEAAAYEFYHELAAKSTIPTAQKVFTFLAEEEEKHIKYVQDLKQKQAGDK